jgi:hypothetical protein
VSAPQLYHFTCRHGMRRIGTFNALLIPQGGRHPVAGWPPLLWFTSLAEPDREATGLTSRILSCDRMEHRYTVAPGSGCVPWPGSVWRAETPEQWIRMLEQSGDPGHWWVSDKPVPARWDRAWAGQARR